MKGLLNKLSTNQKLCYSLSIIVILIAIIGSLIINGNEINIVLDTDTNKSSNNTEPVVVEPEEVGVKEILDIRSEIDNIATRDLINRHIINNETGIYEINGEYYVILANGGESASDIEYNIHYGLDGRAILEWRLSNEPDGLYEKRSKVIKVDSSNIKILRAEATEVEAAANNWAAQFLVFTSGGEKYVYNTEASRLESIRTLEIDGLYIGSVEDNRNMKAVNRLSSVILKDCKVIREIESSRGLYEVDISGKVLHVMFNKQVNNLNKELNIQLTYDLTSNTFHGEVLKEGLM